MFEQDMESEEQTNAVTTPLNEGAGLNEWQFEELVDRLAVMSGLLDVERRDPPSSQERFLCAISRIYYTNIETAVGQLYVAFKGGTLQFLSLEDEKTFLKKASDFLNITPERAIEAHLPMDLLQQVQDCVEKLTVYKGELDVSHLTPFQRMVLEQVCHIPPGEVRSYKEVAQAIGHAHAVGSVGKVIAHNPFPLVIPCHRVIPTNRTLGSYTSGGVDVKMRLLLYEGIPFNDRCSRILTDTSQWACLHSHSIEPLHQNYPHSPSTISPPDRVPEFIHSLRSDEQPALSRYINWLVDRYVYIRVQNVLPYVNQVQFDEVYWSPPILMKPTMIYHPTDRMSRPIEPFLVKKEVEENVMKCTPQDIVKDYPHTVVFGSPGSGKTMLLRHLALVYATKIQHRYIQDEDDTKALLPIPLQLVDLASYIEDTSPPEVSILDFLVYYFTNHGCPSEGLAELLETRFAEGRCLILLDGLDEVSNRQILLKIVRQINHFVTTYNHLHNHFVITSRSTEYYHYLSQSFIICTIQGMERKDVTSFLRLWDKIIEEREPLKNSLQAQEKHRQGVQETLLRVVRMAHSRSICQNPESQVEPVTPLLVQIVIIIYYTIVQWRQQKPELSNLVNTMISYAKHKHKNLPVTVLDEYLTSLFSKVMYMQYLDRHTRGVHQDDKIGSSWKEGGTIVKVEGSHSCCLRHYPYTAVEEVIQVIQQRGLVGFNGPLGEDNSNLKLREDVKKLLQALQDRADQVILPTRRILTS